VRTDQDMGVGIDIDIVTTYFDNTAYVFDSRF
jgi:hypothetical protein